jgi:hypothetical protein
MHACHSVLARMSKRYRRRPSPLLCTCVHFW